MHSATWQALCEHATAGFSVSAAGCTAWISACGQTNDRAWRALQKDMCAERLGLGGPVNSGALLRLHAVQPQPERPVTARSKVGRCSRALICTRSEHPTSASALLCASRSHSRARTRCASPRLTPNPAPSTQAASCVKPDVLRDEAQQDAVVAQDEAQAALHAAVRLCHRTPPFLRPRQGRAKRSSGMLHARKVPDTLQTAALRTARAGRTGEDAGLSDARGRCRDKPARRPHYTAPHTRCLQSALILRQTPLRQPGGARAAPAGTAAFDHGVEGSGGAPRAQYKRDRMQDV